MLKNRSFWLFGILSIIILAILVYLAGIPYLRKLQKMTSEITQKRLDIGVLQEKLTVLQKLKTQEETLLDLADRAQKYLPQSRKEGDFIIDFEKIAQESESTINSTAVIVKAEKKALAEVPKEEEEPKTKTKTKTKTETTKATSPVSATAFSANITTNFRSFLTMLFNLERSRRLSAFDTFTITRGEEDTLSIKMDGEIYHKDKITVSKDLENIKISEEVEQKLKNLGQFGEYINLQSESGFGRDDPFSEF